MWIAVAVIVVVVAFLGGATIYQYVRPPRGKVIGHQSGALEDEATIAQTAKGNANSTWI